MGKNKNKNKDDTPNLASVANRDILQRLNFLFQASVLLNGLTPPYRDDDPSNPTAAGDKGTSIDEGDSSSRPIGSRRKKTRHVVTFGELSRSYVETMKSVGQKTNVRIDPSVKRHTCKRCSAPLIPGISATVRVKDSASHGRLISYQCHCCRAERRIPAPPTLHVDPPASEDAMEAQTPEVSTSAMPAAPNGAVSTAGPRQRKRKKKGPRPRLPPHFARDVGHVVFRGNERLDKFPNAS